MSVQPGPESLLAARINDLVRRNSHELTACQLITAQDEATDRAQRHADEIARIKAHMSDAERIGLRVLRAEASGRKTVRIEELTAKETN